jgi:hypothetical protein
MSPLSRPLANPLLPADSRGDIVPLARLDAELLRTSLSYWRSLREEGSCPRRASMMSCLSPQMRAHSVLIEVLDGGADYEYRFVGEELIKGFQADFSGQRLSTLIALLPKFGISLRMLYEMVRAGGEPLGYRGWVGNDLPGADFVYHESVFLPLGENGVVDHLLAVSMLLLRPEQVA